MLIPSSNVSVNVVVTQDSNTSLFDSRTITFNLNPENNTPTIDTSIDDLVINEDNGTLSYELNATDIEGEALHITVDSNDTEILTVSPSWDMNSIFFLLT